MKKTLYFKYESSISDYYDIEYTREVEDNSYIPQKGSRIVLEQKEFKIYDMLYFFDENRIEYLIEPIGW